MQILKETNIFGAQYQSIIVTEFDQINCIMLQNHQSVNQNHTYKKKKKSPDIICLHREFDEDHHDPGNVVVVCSLSGCFQADSEHSDCHCC